MERGKFVIIVLDGFGVGQMLDVDEVRPEDLGANTCAHIFERMPSLRLPNLAALGLANAVAGVPGVAGDTGSDLGTSHSHAPGGGHILRASGDYGDQAARSAYGAHTGGS